MTEYPRDQFDDVPEYTNRRGSHRAATEPAAPGPSGLAWISIVAAFALAVGAFFYFIYPTLRPGPGNGPANDLGAAAESPAPSASSPPATSASRPPASPVPASPEPTPSATEVTAESGQAEEPQAVDYAFPVEVYNASRIDGLAARARGTLAASGFTVATAGNWAGFPANSSAVFYSSHQATAQAAAARLGVPAVYDARVPGIAVVLTGN